MSVVVVCRGTHGPRLLKVGWVVKGGLKLKGLLGEKLTAELGWLGWWSRQWRWRLKPLVVLFTIPVQSCSYKHTCDSVVHM